MIGRPLPEAGVAKTERETGRESAREGERGRERRRREMFPKQFASK